MSVYAVPILFTLFVWWFSTGIILVVAGLPRWTSRWSMLASTGLLLAACYELWATRDDDTLLGTYAAFASVVMVWAWQETGFLLGFVTGPRKSPCPPGAVGWRRAQLALQTILYHELTLLALAIVVWALTFEGRNRVGIGTFVVFWALRQSAKLNLFLGVRNLSEEFLPTHLRYLASYFTRKRMNPLLPFSVLASAWFTGLAWQQAVTASTEASTAGFALLGSLLALGVLEHLFLVLPFPVTALWRWSLAQRDRVRRRRVERPRPMAIAARESLQILPPKS